MWFGAHPSGPTILEIDGKGVRMDHFLLKEPSMVGGLDLYVKFNKTLPFLFKILSVDQPLSLQAHPDKKLADILHRKDARNYPDANHKPELAIALTDFEVLCDFRPHKEILALMQSIKSFSDIVNREHYLEYLNSVTHNENHEFQRKAMADCFKSLMTKDRDTIMEASRNILEEAKKSGLVEHNVIEALSTISKLYPGDPGIYAIFFLNYIKLSPGQAIYLKPNKLHAYLRGECIECMACSDNVVRAGLTTKYRDVETLLSMLDYKTTKKKDDLLLSRIKHKDCRAITSYVPSDEFKVDEILVQNIDVHDGKFVIKPVTSGSFILVFGGRATTRDFFKQVIEHRLELGSAGFVPPKVAITLCNIECPLSMYRAYC